MCLFLLPLYYLILNRFLLPIQVVNYEIPNTQRDPKLETQRVLSFRSSTTTLQHYHQQDKQGLETHHVSSLGKSSFFLYYFINNSYFYRQNYCSITVVSRRLPHKAGIDINKEQGGGKVRRWQEGTGARDVTRLEPRYIFFFLISLIRYINRYYRP